MCPVKGKNYGKGTLWKVFFDVSKVSGKLFWPEGQVNRLVKRFSIYTGIIYIMGLEGAKGWGN